MRLDTSDLFHSINDETLTELVAINRARPNFAQMVIELDQIKTNWENTTTANLLFLSDNEEKIGEIQDNIINTKTKLIREFYLEKEIPPTTLIVNKRLASKLVTFAQIVPYITWNGLATLAILLAEEVQISAKTISQDSRVCRGITIFKFNGRNIELVEMTATASNTTQPTDILTIIYKLYGRGVKHRHFRIICELLEKINLLQLDRIGNEIVSDDEYFETKNALDSRQVVAIFFPHNPAYKRTGAHQRILLIIQDMLQLGVSVTFISTVAFTDTTWDDWSINYLISLGVSRVEIIQDAIIDIEHRKIARESWSSRFFETYTPPYLTHRVKEILNEVKPECLYINYAYWAELSVTNNEIGSRNVLDLHDFLGRSIKLAKDASDSSPFHANLLSAEISAFAKVDKIIAVSQPDYNQLKDIYSLNTVCYLPVAPKHKIQYASSKSDGIRKFVFVGSNNNINTTSIRLFINEVLPKILQHGNDFALNLYGSICERLPDVAGINLHGWQPEEEIFDMNSVLLCPLISATGMQVKIAEAFSNSTPVICYAAISAQNEVVNGYNGIIANNTYELYEACLKLRNDDELFQRCQKGAAETSKHRYNQYQDSLRDILFGTMTLNEH